MKDAVRALLERGGYLRDIGDENIFPGQDRAQSPPIYPRLDPEICRTLQACASFANASSCPTASRRAACPDD